MERLENLHTVSGNVKYAAALKNDLAISQKVKRQLPHDSAIPLLDIYLKKMKTLIQKGTCTPKFRAV